MVTSKKRLVFIILSIGLLLFIHLTAMQFTNDVSWSVFDFIVAGILLFCTGFMFEFIMRKIKKKQTRIILILFLAILLFLIWAELSVGIFGTPWAGN